MKLFFSVFLAALLLIGGGCKKAGLDEKEADVPAWLNYLPAEDVLWGIGTAKTESDGESILLAEDRARTQIAQQMSTQASNYRWESKEQSQSVDFTQFTTSTTVIGSRVIRRYKDKNGAWWCLVEASKANTNWSSIEPAQDDLTEMLQSNAAILRSNRESWPDVKNAVMTDDIPDWVFNDNILAENVIYGVGAAKLDNDEDAVSLAMERTRRSLARSLSAEIHAVRSEYSENESIIYEDEVAVVTSVYEYTPRQMLLENLAKTKDGTFWVLLGWVKPSVPAIDSFSAEERMNQAFDRILNEETQQ